MQAPQKKRIILLGSSARAAAASAIAAGCRVTAVDSFGDADLREMCQSYRRLPSASLPLAFLRSQRPSTIVLLGGCERWTDSFALLGDHHRIAGATATQWRLVKQLSVLCEIASAAGVRMPASRAFADDNIDRPPIGHDASGRWLIKTAHSCGGLGVRWSAGGRVAPGEFYQRWISGTPIGASYLAAGKDVHLLGVCRGLKFRTASHPAIYAGSCGPLHMAPEWTDKLVRVGEVTAQRLQLRGLFNVDLVLHPNDGLYLLEINPRYTASMELLEPNSAVPRARQNETMWKAGASPPSLIAAHLECFDRPFEKATILSASPRRGHDPAGPVRCKRVVFARKTIVFGAEKRRSFQAVVKEHSARWADIPTEGTTIFAQRPLCSIFTEGESAAIALRRTGRLLQAMREIVGPAG